MPDTLHPIQRVSRLTGLSMHVITGYDLAHLGATLDDLRKPRHPKHPTT
ncbi:MAG: hypothetical protein WCK77_18060 [Verrucomicrobiota bacterium]